MSPNLTVVDFGSLDVNGSLKPIFKNHNYKGIDLSEGPNVDIVCDGKKTPFADNSVDIIVSSSNFEHDICFWMTFLEMCRILKNDGYIYINVPSSGPYHAYPLDCWRFYKDSWKALEIYANANTHNIKLIETYIDSKCFWKNNIGIFKKSV
jgi:predicted SAM-dependent methyltransferase